MNETIKKILNFKILNKSLGWLLHFIPVLLSVFYADKYFALIGIKRFIIAYAVFIVADLLFEKLLIMED